MHAHVTCRGCSTYLDVGLDGEVVSPWKYLGAVAVGEPPHVAQIAQEPRLCSDGYVLTQSKWGGMIKIWQFLRYSYDDEREISKCPPGVTTPCIHQLKS